MDREHSHDLQEAVFDASFAAQADRFTVLYESISARRRVRELARFGAGGRLLEVGVGRGHLLQALRDASFVVEGLDVSPAVCSVVQRKLGIPVHHGTLEEFAESSWGAQADVLVMCHVLEHIGDVGTSLASVHRLLRAGGLLYIAVPNIGAWEARLPGWSGYEPYHVHYFDATGLSRVLAAHGFTVLSLRSHEPLTGWFNALARSMRYHEPPVRAGAVGSLSPRIGVRMRLAYEVVRLATGAALMPLRWFQARLGAGEELVAVARRRDSSWENRRA